jgi:beta-lactamase superfamily II metal-dependent hydrolase
MEEVEMPVKPSPKEKPQLTVTALGVGHGDAVLLTWSEGKDRWTCLIDGGESEDLLFQGLKRARVNKLDLLVLTHFDSDHMGGLHGLTSRVQVTEFWGPALPAYMRHLWIFGDRCRQALRRASELEAELREAGVSISYPLEGYQSVPWSDRGPRLEVLSPPARFVRTLLTDQNVAWLFTSTPTPLGWLLEPAPGILDQPRDLDILDDALRHGLLTPDTIPQSLCRPTQPNDDARAVQAQRDSEFFGDSMLNNSSLVLWLEVPVGARNHRVLLTADQENWTYLCAQHPRGLHADVLKASHHGGRVYLEQDLALDTLLGAVRPRAVLISANGSHGLPRASFRSAAITWGATVFCTSQRGREVVLGGNSERDCCHNAFGCTKATRDVTIILDAEGIHSPNLACHSGWGGEPGPVVQVQQHLIAPSRIISRLFEQELRRHLAWIRAKLMGIHQARQTQPAKGQKLDAVRQQTFLQLAREVDPPRYDLIAHLDTVLTEGMRRGRFWAVKADYGREWHAYALPTTEEIDCYLNYLRDVGLILYPALKDTLAGDYDTLLSDLDKARFMTQAENLLRLPAEAFTDTIWPRVCREFKKHWRWYKLPGVNLILSIQPPNQFYAMLLRSFVRKDERGRLRISAEGSNWDADQLRLLSGSESTYQINEVLDSLLMLQLGQLGTHAEELMELLRQHHSAAESEYEMQEQRGREGRRGILSSLLPRPHEEAREKLERAAAALKRDRISITEALALPNANPERISQLLPLQVRSFW